MNKLQELKENLSIIEKRLNLNFENKEILLLAFVHRSFVNENKKLINEHNERLEYLGDSALNFIVSNYLYDSLKTSNEGKLSHIRSRLVDATSCVKYIKLLNLQEYILLGKGEENTVDKGKDTIYSDGFEALVGAIYLDRGFNKTKEFLINNFKTIFDEVIQNPEVDYKGSLQEYCQKKYQKPPEYRIIKEEGPEHLKIFYISVYVNDEEIATASGNSKKEAEILAAEKAYNLLNI